MLTQLTSEDTELAQNGVGQHAVGHCQTAQSTNRTHRLCQKPKTMALQQPKHHVQNSVISDYESDGHYLSDIPPPPPERTDEEVNLAVLRRYNKDVLSLEYVAPYVVVYTFNPESLTWEKSGMEGSTFLCALQPNAEYAYRCAVVVLNRRSLENLNLELFSPDNVEITDEYIILKTDVSDVTQIYGLWVFREPPPSSTAHHPEQFAKKVQECVQKVGLSHRSLVRAQSNGLEEKQEEVPMGRQISLSELFGQQRQEDDSFSVRSHNSSRPSTQAVQQAVLPQQFATTADTDFFRSSSKPATTPSPAISAQSNGQQRDTLLDLFRKASEKRNG